MVHPQHTLHYPGSYVFEIKVKVKLSLWLHAMRKDLFSKWRNAPLMLCRWMWGSCSSCFTATEIGPRTLWLGGRMSPRADMGAVVNRKRFDPGRMWVLMFHHSAHNADTILNELSQLIKFDHSRKNLCMFAELHKATISFIMSVCPSICLSVHMEQLSSQWADFYEIWYLTISPKMCQENSSLIKIWQV
jgi:hypothetical protein